MDDARTLLRWRNDPHTRAASHQVGEVTLLEHVQWLERTLASPTCKLYIAEVDGQPVGTMRADITDGVTSLSWTVAPEVRRRSVGRQMVSMLAASISGPIRAEVKASNVASQRIAEAAGMTVERSENGALHYVRKAPM